MSCRDTGAEKIVEVRSDDWKARQRTETERAAAEQAERKAEMAAALERAAPLRLRSALLQRPCSVKQLRKPQQKRLREARMILNSGGTSKVTIKHIAIAPRWRQRSRQEWLVPVVLERRCVLPPHGWATRRQLNETSASCAMVTSGDSSTCGLKVVANTGEIIAPKSLL